MRRYLLLLFLLSAHHLIAADTPATKLCVAAGVTLSSSDDACTTVDSGTRNINGGEGEQLYLWTSEDGLRTNFGVIAPDGADVVSPLETRRGISRFRLASTSAFWPEPVDVDVKQLSTGIRWRWRARCALRCDLEIAIPEGLFELTFSAPHHFPLVLKQTATYRAQSLALVPYPIVRGRIIDKSTRQGLPGATVTDQDERLLGSVGELTGEFEFEVDRTAPKEVSVAFPGRATAVVRLQTGGETDIGVVELSSGATLTAGLPESVSEDVDVDLMQIPNPGEFRPMAHVKYTASSPIVFRDLHSGTYQVLAHRGELEKFGIQVHVSEGEQKTVELPIADVNLKLSVRDRRGPVKAHVRLMNNEERWVGEVDTDERGVYEGKMWQQGTYGAIVTLPNANTPYAAHQNISGTEATWDIEVSGVTISGTVKSTTDEPIAGAHVNIFTEWPKGQQRKLLSTTDAGSFAADFIPPGSHVINVTADGYLPSETNFQTLATDTERKLDIRLTKGNLKTLRVVNRDNVPLPNAIVFDTATAVVLHTAPDGTAKLSLPVGTTSTVFLVPADGSIAAAMLRGTDSPDEEKLVVPPGESTLQVNIEDEEGRPASGATVLLRMNGYLVPLQVMEFFAPGAPYSLRTDSNGQLTFAKLPVAVYDVWAVFDLSRLSEFMLAPPTPLTQVAMHPGMNKISVILKRNRSDETAGR